MPKYKCELCDGRVFFSEAVYQSHIKISEKHKVYVCPVADCAYASHLESGLDAHFEAKHPRSRLWSCTSDGCFAKFTSASHLSAHGRGSHPDPISCSNAWCEATFINDEEMDLHFLAKHAQKHCSICAYNVYESDWEDHWTKIPAHRLCKGCDLAFETSESYIQHSAVPHTQLRCKICSATFLNTELLEFHVKKSHNYCNLCDAQFTFYRELAYHTKTVHSDAAPVLQATPKSKPTETSRVSLPDDICTCRICNRGSRQTSATQPTCKNCQAIFIDHVSLQQHSLAKHPESHAKLLKDGGISKCHLCQVVYQTPLALQQHMLAKHAGAKNVAPIVLVDSDNNSVVGPTESPIVNKTLPTQISQAASLRSNSNSSAHSSASAAASLSKAIPVIESHSVSPAPSSISLSSAAISDAVMVKTDAASSDDLLSLRDDQSDVDDDKTSVVSEAMTVVLETTLTRAETGMHITPSQAPTSQSNTYSQQALPRMTPIPIAEDLRRDANKAAGPPAPLMVMRCALCKDSPADPVLTMCGHIFCHGCLMPEVSRSLQCPSCKRPLFVRIDVPVS